MITLFNKSVVQDVRKEIDAKLAELKYLGLDIELGNIRFSDSNFTAQLKCNIQGGDDEFVAAYKDRFESDLYPDAVGSVIMLDGKKFTFRGFKPRARTNRAIIENARGDLFRARFSTFEHQL